MAGNAHVGPCWPWSWWLVPALLPAGAHGMLAPGSRDPQPATGEQHLPSYTDPRQRPIVTAPRTTDDRSQCATERPLRPSQDLVLGTRRSALSGGGYLSSRDAHPRPRPSSSHRASCSARHSAGVEQAHGVMPGVRRIRNRADKAAAPPPRRSGSGLLTVIELPPPAPPRVSRSTRVVCPSAPRLHPCVPALATGVPGWRP